MKKNYISALVSLISLTLSAQCPTAPVTLNTQTAVDNFAIDYPGCTELPAGADLTITGSNIANLNGLSGLTSSNAAIEIRNNPQLISISGLQLTHVNSDFIIRSNALLPNLNGLQNLTSVQGEFTLRTNANLADISALGSLATVGLGVIIRDNPSLATLNGLQNLSVVGDILELTENDILADISALGNISSITGGEEGALIISANPLLTSIAGLGNNATSITGDITIEGNALLSQCAAQSICNYLALAPVDAIITIAVNLAGCNSITEVESQCELLNAENPLKDSISLYPNPVHGTLNIHNNSAGKTQLNFYNSAGQFVKSVTVLQNSTAIPVDSLAPGLYLVELSSGNAKAFQKIVIH